MKILPLKLLSWMKIMHGFFLKKLLFGPWTWEKTFVIMTALPLFPVKY